MRYIFSQSLRCRVEIPVGKRKGESTSDTTRPKTKPPSTLEQTEAGMSVEGGSCSRGYAETRNALAERSLYTLKN
jgi:hypothetical protein